MGKRPELTYVINIIMEDGSIVPFDDMTEEQHRLWEKNTCARLSENMSDYYTQHPDRYKSLCDALDKEMSG